MQKIRKRAGCIFTTASLGDTSRHLSAYPDMSSALEPSGSRRFTSLKESRQVLRVRLLAACQNVVIVYTHPRFIPKITAIFIIVDAIFKCFLTIFLDTTWRGSLVDSVQNLLFFLLLYSV